MQPEGDLAVCPDPCPNDAPTSWNRNAWRISEEDTEALLVELKRARR
jgi:hypothetical protein